LLPGIQQGVRLSLSGKGLAEVWTEWLLDARRLAFKPSSLDWLPALEFAKHYAERRSKGVGKIFNTPYIFPPSKNSVDVRYRPPYNCSRTYATMRAMSGMNPAFISQQLGHSVQMLLSTYARWNNSSSDWSELEKLQMGPEWALASIRVPKDINR